MATPKRKRPNPWNPSAPLLVGLCFGLTFGITHRLLDGRFANLVRLGERFELKELSRHRFGEFAHALWLGSGGFAGHTRANSSIGSTSSSPRLSHQWRQNLLQPFPPP